MPNTFAWQGFSISLPQDWDPTNFSGDRATGFARISSAGATQLQIRWQSFKKEPEPEAVLARYFKQIHRESSRRKTSVETESKQTDIGLEYHWNGAESARGCVIVSKVSRRLFFLEISSAKGKASLATFREVLGSFLDNGDALPDCWSLLGLSVSLPKQAILKRSVLLSGKLQLHWTAHRAVLSAGRTSFGRELMGKMNLSEWAKSIAPKGTVVECEHGVRIESIRRAIGRTVSSSTIAKFDENANKLVYATAMFRDPIWRPEWDWLN